MMESLKHRLIVSCQASEGEAFYGSEYMARFARAAVDGGAAGIRANGPADIRAIRQALDVPVFGIQKRMHADGRILITPAFEDAQALVEAGATAVALDCTARGRATGALDRIRRIKAELRVPVLADIATCEEAVAAAEAGADFVLSTMRGYTAETADVRAFEPAFISKLVRSVTVPVIAEGRINSPAEARRAIAAGAFAVIVGTAITRPHDITRWFAEAVAPRRESVIGIDLGGTNTKYGVVSPDGKLASEGYLPTPPGGGRDALLGVLKAAARRSIESGPKVSAIGIATAGWVDPGSGRVAYATENLPGWTGTRIADELCQATGLPVAVENDANALAVAEHYFGAARGCDNFVCITLGTGVGGGCYVGGHLNRGAHFFANALGHVQIEPDGLGCTCGRRGCLEVYSNAAALMRYAGAGYGSAEEVIRAANGGDATARDAVRRLANRLARGCAVIVHVLDPEMLILSGGLAQNNPALVTDLEAEMAGLTTVWEQRRLKIRLSPLAYYGGVFGAAAVALEKMA